MKKLDYTIEPAKNGEKTIKVHGLYLHSTYYPSKEAEKIVRKHYTKGRLFILFGLGLGYLVKAFDELLDPEYDHLFVIEPSSDLFDIAIREANVKEVLQKSYISFFVGTQQEIAYWKLGQLIDEHAGKIVIIDSPNYKQLFDEEYGEFLNKVKELSYLNIVNINTIFAWSKNWQQNLLSNLYSAIEATPFAKLTEEKLNCPVIIASGGPSLTKQLELLKTVENRALIICAGSTINSLLKYGIKPHILVVIDGAEVNFAHFKDVEDIHDIPLFYPLIVYREIPSYHQGEKVVFNLQKDELSETIDRIFYEKLGHVRGGGSVATFCLSIAQQLTNGPICLIGQDLAYTNFQTHAEGNRLGKKLDKSEFSNTKKYLKVKGFYEDEVFTDYSFYSMKQTFEQLIKSFGDRVVYNATEGGAFIEGAVHLPFADFITKHCNVNVAQDLNTFREKIDASKFDKALIKQSLYEFIQHSLENINKVIELSKQALNYVENIKSDEELVLINNELEEVEEKIKLYLDNGLLEYLFMTTVFKLFYQLDASSLVEKSRFLYQSIMDLSKQAKMWLEDLQQKIEEMNM
nr:6-hydroxymethylpterin diphosphokinase MptE-like protein [Anoxybacillus sp.]